MKILILFGHPAFQNSIVNKHLVDGLEDIPNVTFHDLYEAYPEMDIDIDYEQELMEQHDCIVFMHPMYWYSAPAIFKEWQDLVLEHGWAYGSKGKALEDKLFFNALSTGAAKCGFSVGKLQNHSVTDFLVPFHQMATLCKMKPLPPFVTHGTHLLSDERLNIDQSMYHTLLRKMSNNEFTLGELCKYEYLNELVERK